MYLFILFMVLYIYSYKLHASHIAPMVKATQHVQKPTLAKQLTIDTKQKPSSMYQTLRVHHPYHQRTSFDPV